MKSDERTWVRIGFHGVPYRIAKELIDKVYFCNGCEEIIDLKEDFLENHLLHFHYGDSNISVKPYFGDILLVPGPGHKEKNFLLAIFKFEKDIFMFKLADKLGFKSSKAKDFIINCGNHHLWQIANIAFDAFAKELIHIFLQCCEWENLQLTIENFVNWRSQKVVNSNFNFYYDLVFKIFLGLKCYCAGIRCNNSQHAMAGRQAVAPLIFIGNHLIYQTILLNDMKERLEAPKEVYDFITGNE